MSSVPSSLFRVSTATSGDLLTSNLRRTNVSLLRLQNELTTGRRVNKPSDDPAAMGAISSLRDLLARFEQQEANLARSSAVSDVTDSALRDLGDILLEVQGIASSQLGVVSDAGTRANQAEVVDLLIDAVVGIVNRDHLGISLFGGRESDGRPFETALSGIRYTGSTENLTDLLSDGDELAINTNGVSALGALSGRVRGTVDVEPGAMADTLLSDVNGARNLGVAAGSILININGTAAELNLSGAGSLGDVADLVTDAIGGAGSLAVVGNGFQLTANGGNTITIADIGAGVTAADLGIAISAASGSTAGADVQTRLTELSRVADFGASIDFSGGLKITNGGITTVVDFSSAVTVQDLINQVENADLGVRLTINAAGSGFDLVNEVSGALLSVGENAGGTTATDLGLRSLSAATALSDFNDGLGVRINEGQDDFRIELGDGSFVDVNLDGAASVNDVLGAINTAGGGAVTASLAGDGNGIVLTDNVGGGGDFRVLALNESFAAADLGIAKNVGAAGTLVGDDNAQIRPDSIFTHMIMLRDALFANDSRLITIAGEKLEDDTGRVAVVRAGVGVRAGRIESERARVADRELQTRSILSSIQDTDFTEAVTRFTQLQQQLEAGLLAAQQNLSLSLLDFLR